jgi:hypothetical protein
MVAGGTTSGSAGKLAYTYDGITWTASTAAVFTTRCNTVAWNGTIWVAGGSGTNVLAYSSDGITWTLADVSGIDPAVTECFALGWNGIMWVAGVDTGFIYSYDGINWNNADIVNDVLANCLTLVWKSDMWLAGGTLGNGVGAGTICSSTDGLIWTKSNSGSERFTTSCNSIAWNGRLLVAGGVGTASKIATSSDSGFTWVNSISGNLVLTNYCRSVAWNGSIWLAGGSGSAYNIARSSDGTTWTGKTIIDVTAVNSVAWNGSVWVAGGTGTNKIAYSSDNGSSWTTSASGTAILSGQCNTVASRIVSSYITPTNALINQFATPIITASENSFIHSWQYITGANSADDGTFIIGTDSYTLVIANNDKTGRSAIRWINQLTGLIGGLKNTQSRLIITLVSEDGMTALTFPLETTTINQTSTELVSSESLNIPFTKDDYINFSFTTEAIPSEAATTPYTAANSADWGGTVTVPADVGSALDLIAAWIKSAAGALGSGAPSWPPAAGGSGSGGSGS